jgi:hypothetical protein
MVIQYLKNTLVISTILFLIATLITFLLSELEGIPTLIGKSILLFIPLHLTYRTILSIKLDFNEYKHENQFEKIVSIILHFAGIIFMLFCFFYMIKSY